MTGNRSHPNREGELWLKPGDYGKGIDGVWQARTPNGLTGRLGAHDVVEHEDGTITVSPSILVHYPDPDNPGQDIRNWHGYLEHGVWREC